MNFSRAIHFPECLSRYFRHIFRHETNFETFSMYFSTLATLGSKNTSKMSRNSSRVEKNSQKYRDKHKGRLIARLIFIDGRLYKFHKYIGSFVYQDFFGVFWRFFGRFFAFFWRFLLVCSNVRNRVR